MTERREVEVSGCLPWLLYFAALACGAVIAGGLRGVADSIDNLAAAVRDSAPPTERADP